MDDSLSAPPPAECLLLKKKKLKNVTDENLDIFPSSNVNEDGNQTRKRKKKKKEYVTELEYENMSGNDKIEELSIDSSNAINHVETIFEAQETNRKKKREKKFIEQDLESSGAINKKSEDQVHDSLSALPPAECVLLKKKKQKNVTVENLDIFTSSNVNKDGNQTQKRKKKKKEYVTELEYENMLSGNDKIEELSIDSSNATNHVETIYEDQEINVKKKREKKFIEQDLEISYVINKKSEDQVHDSLSAPPPAECVLLKKKKQKNVTDENLSIFTSSNVNEDGNQTRKRKGKKEYVTELDENMLSGNDKIEELSIDSSNAINHVETIFEAQETNRKKKREKKFIELDFESSDAINKKSEDQVHGSISAPPPAEYVLLKKKKQKNVTDENFDIFSSSNVNEDDNQTRKRKKKKKEKYATEVENVNMISGNAKIEELGINPSGTTNHSETIVEVQDTNRKRRKKHFMGTEFVSSGVLCQESEDPMYKSLSAPLIAECMLLNKRKKLNAVADDMLTPNADEKLDRFSSLTLIRDNDHEKKKNEKSTTAVRKENDAFNEKAKELDIINNVVIANHLETIFEGKNNKSEKEKKQFKNNLYDYNDESVTNSAVQLHDSLNHVHALEQSKIYKKNHQSNVVSVNAIESLELSQNIKKRRKEKALSDDEFLVSHEIEKDIFIETSLEQRKSKLGTNQSKIHLINEDAINPSLTSNDQELSTILPYISTIIKPRNKLFDDENTDTPLYEENDTIKKGIKLHKHNIHDKELGEYKIKAPNLYFYSNPKNERNSSDIDLTFTTGFIVPDLYENEVPVNFDIPELHESESVSSLSKEERVALESKGIKIKIGKWSKSEDAILRKNYNEFCGQFKINDPCMLLGLGKSRRVPEVVCFLKAKHFYIRLGKDLNNRTLNSIYYRARILFHPLKNVKTRSPKDVPSLKHAYNLYGNKWNEIGVLLNKRASQVRESYRWNRKLINKGKWTPEEDEKLISAIKTVSGTSEPSSKLIKAISWEKVAELVPTRNQTQCRLHYGEQLANAPGVTELLTWNTKCIEKLFKVIKSKHYKDESEIDWEIIYEYFKDVAPSYMFLQKRWRRLKGSCTYFETINNLFVI